MTLKDKSTIIYIPIGGIGTMEKNMEISHKDQLKRLNKIEGQVKGIKKMIEENRYCMDILIQLKGVISALSKVRNNILREHLEHCVKQGLTSGNSNLADEKIEELISYIDKMC